MISDAYLVAGFILTLATLAGLAFPLWKMSVTANQLQENVLPWFTPPGPDSTHVTLPVQVTQIREAADAAAEEARMVRADLRLHMHSEEELSRIDIAARSLERGHSEAFREEVIARLARLENRGGT